jgi:hypothetical protein
MDRDVLNHIFNGVVFVDSYFLENYDCTRCRILSALQKVIVAMHILTYGLSADAVDEFVQIAESTARGALEYICRVVISTFGKEYLRSLNTANVAHLLQEGEARGFPGMLGSIDGIHWEWSRYPSAWKDFFTGRGKHPSMILEVATSHDLWIWYAYFGLLDSCNDINILQRSPNFSACE